MGAFLYRAVCKSSGAWGWLIFVDSRQRVTIERVAALSDKTEGMQNGPQHSGGTLLASNLDSPLHEVIGIEGQAEVAVVHEMVLLDLSGPCAQRFLRLSA